MYFDLSFAALISFALLFGLWELIVLVLFAVFILNWQPAVSIEILIFALYPIAVHFVRNIFQWQQWLKNLVAITVGFLVLYIGAGGTGFIHHPQTFLLDLLAGLVFGALIFTPLYGWEK